MSGAEDNLNGPVGSSFVEPTLLYIREDDWRMIREALSNYVATYPTCPCGAWTDRLDERPHVIGCPVGAMQRRSFI